MTADHTVFAGPDGSVERMKLLGANPKLRFEPLDKQPGISNYFISNDSITTLEMTECLPLSFSHA